MPISTATFGPKWDAIAFRHRRRFRRSREISPGWLATAPNLPDTAFTAHRRLVNIHPFNDGNGRTARLLMNLILIRGGYPPVAVRPEDRLEYIRGLQQEKAGQGAEGFNALLYKRLDATLEEYLSALQEAQTPEGKPR